jgi:GTP-binding protein LepA
VISPETTKCVRARRREVGYLITGVKDVASPGSATPSRSTPSREDALGGYKIPKPMVYSGPLPIDGSDYPLLRDALDKLKLNDARSTTSRRRARARLRVPLRASSACCTWRSSASG